jgi:hypothetical protein
MEELWKENVVGVYSQIILHKQIVEIRWIRILMLCFVMLINIAILSENAKF